MVLPNQLVQGFYPVRNAVRGWYPSIKLLLQDLFALDPQV